MMKSALTLLALASTASAFAPQQAPKSSVALNAEMDKYYGAVNYKLEEFKFDPLKLSETYAPLMPWFREAEIKHGRTAMLAVVGFITTDFIRIPGEMYSFEAIPKTIDAHDALLKQGPMSQILLWVGLWDLIVTAPAAAAAMKGEREPGDFAWYTFAPSDPETLEKKKASELLNGRLAMCAVGGIATQSIITGHGFPYV